MTKQSKPKVPRSVVRIFTEILSLLLVLWVIAFALPDIPWVGGVLSFIGGVAGQIVMHVLEYGYEAVRWILRHLLE